MRFFATGRIKDTLVTFVVGRGILLCCTILFFGAQAVVSDAHAQAIEEGGVPVKGGDLFGESFSLSCLPRLVARAGESLLLSCAATGVSEERVRYRWESVSGEGFRYLSAPNELSPLFAVPETVEEDETYEYLLTVSAENAENGSAAVTVTVLNYGALSVTCEPPPLVYEGAPDFHLDCTASGAPDGSRYEYTWVERAGTENTDLLSATDIASPTFLVPDEVDAATEYEYLLTVSAENAEDGSVEMTVTVLDIPPLVLDDAIDGRVYVYTVGETIEDILLPDVQV